MDDKREEKRKPLTDTKEKAGTCSTGEEAREQRAVSFQQAPGA